MKAVDIFRRRPDAETEHLGRVVVRRPGGPAELEVFNPDLREGLEWTLSLGVVDDRGRPLELADGDAFLAALPEFFRGSRFWAEPAADQPSERRGA